MTTKQDRQDPTRLVPVLLSEHQGGMPAWARMWAADSRLMLLPQLAVVGMTSTLAVLIARSLGPSEWGLFSALLGLTQGFAVFVEFGLGTSLLRELSRLWAESTSNADGFHAQAGQLVMAALMLNAGLGTVLVLGGIVATTLLRWSLDLSLALVGLLVYGTVLAVSVGLETVFRARRRLGMVVGATLLEKGLLLGLVGLSLLAGGGLSGIALAHVVGATSRMVFDGLGIVLTSDIRPPVPRVGAAFDLARRSLPFLLNTALLNAVARLDVTLVAGLSATDAGYFGVGDRVVGVALVVPAVASSTLYPFLAGEGRSSRPTREAAGVLGMTGGAFAAVGISAAPLLVPAVFGNAYLEAVRTVQVMLLVLPLTFVSSALMAGLYSRGLERRMVPATALVALGGTAAVLTGEMLLGPVGAGLGYVFRQGMVTAALAGLVVSDERRSRTGGRAKVDSGETRLV